MNMRKLFKIIDISVVSAVLLGVFGYMGISVLESKKAHDIATEERLNSLKDDKGHIPSTLKAVTPTATSVGYTEGKKCLLCGEIYEGHVEIPMLTEDNYTRTVTKSSAGMKVTWELKSQYTQELGEYKIEEEHPNGYIEIDGTNYLPYDFNKTFDGIEMSYDELLNTIVWNVTKVGGVTLEDNYVKCATTDTSLKITGQPLTLVNNALKDCIELKKGNLYIENDTTIYVHDHKNTLTDKTGIVAGKLDVAKGASLHVSNYQYGVYLEEGTSQIFGTLNISGATKFISSSLSNRKFKIGDDNALYINESKKTVTDGVWNIASGQHVTVCDKNIDVKDAIYYVIADLVRPTETSKGHVVFCCADCGGNQFEEDLPMLTDPAYSKTTTRMSVDNIYKDIPCYSYKVNTHPHVQEVAIDQASAQGFIKGNGNLYSLEYWNNKFSNTQATQSGSDSAKVLTITTNSNQTVGTSDGFDGGISFSGFSKVVFAGSGTLTINFSSDVDVLTVDELEIQQGASLKIVGKSAKNSSGIICSKKITIGGKLDISTVNRAINMTNGDGSKCTVDITPTGEFVASNVSVGIVNTVACDFKSLGKFTFDNTSVGSTGDTMKAAFRAEHLLNATFAGTSITDIRSDTFGITGIGDVSVSGSGITNNSPQRQTANAPRIKIQDSANFKITSKDECLHWINRFLIDNENGTKCNAKVELTTNSVGTSSSPKATISFPQDPTKVTEDHKHYLSINSTQRVLITCSNASKGSAGIYIKGKALSLKLASQIKFTNFNSAISTTSNITFKAAEISVLEDNEALIVVNDGSTAIVYQTDGNPAALATHITKKSVEA